MSMRRKNSRFQKRLYRLCSILLCLCWAWMPAKVFAQAFTSRIYAIGHGLPDNNLHCLLQDKRGFIWIGTESGLVRFDGNNFRQYGTVDGLPDNEIIALRADDEGRIWVLAYRGVPAVYDPLKDRFEQAGPDVTLIGERGLDALEGGGIAVNAPGTVVIYRKGLVQQLVSANKHVNALRAQTTVALGKEHYLLVAADSFRVFERGQFAWAQASLLPPNARTAYVNHALYYCDSNGICKTALSSTGAVQQMCMARRTLNASRLSFTGKHLALISDNGTSASLIDTAMLAEVAHLPLNGALARDVLEDGEGNIWIASIGQGLIKLSQPRALSYNSFLPTDMVPSTVAVDGPVMLCGDDKGRVAIFRNGCMERLINISRWSKAVSRIRGIVVLKDGYYIAVEGDASLLVDKQYNIVSVYNRPYLNFSDRCAVLWHDSIILAGGHTQSVKLDYKNCHGYDTAAIRTTAIGADIHGHLIIGSSDGVYRKDDSGLHYLGSRYAAMRNRVNEICTTPDGLVWVGMATNYLVAFEQDSIVATIPFDKRIRGSVCNALCTGKPGQIWVGTDASLSCIDYSITKGDLSWRATSFGATDGLEGQVTDIAVQHDTVYVTTSSGFYSFPAQMAPVLHDIPVYITGIRINDRDTILNTSWQLPYSARDWDIHFAGVTLSGITPAYQYRINSEPWQDIAEAHLLLTRLAPGVYDIQIRALRQDGTPSSQAAVVHIRLQAPFWMSVWFWIAVLAVLLGISVWILQHFFRKKREKQLRQINAESELITSQLQTFSALMNPHFIFNALNSIQHYVLVQDKLATNRYLSGFGRLIRMNFESAQKSYISLEEELERLQLYLSLEQMRFGDKLSYTIAIAEDVAPEDWQIPAMIIQPYLENALLHGIAPATINGTLEIQISREGNDLHICICDNGIGMEASRRLKQPTEHASRSLELIRRRIAILGKLHKQAIRIEVSPYHPEDTQHPGTRVTMIFPDHFVG